MTTPRAYGWRLVKPAAAPAAGAEFTLTADGIGPILLQSLVFRLVTSAAVAVRVPTLVMDDGTDVFWRSVASSAQVASQTVDYGATAGISVGATPPVTPETVVGTNPAAGVEISVTVPAGRYWQLETVQFTFVTSVVVANRRVALVIDDGVNEVTRIVASLDQAASQTVEYVFAGYVDESAVRAGVLLEPLPAVTLGPGWRIRTVTANLQGTDDYGAPVVGFDDTGVAAFGQLTIPASGLLLQRGHRLRSVTSAIDAGDLYSGVVARGFEMPHDQSRFVMPTLQPLYQEDSA